MLALRVRPRSETGAAAVEFALLFWIFIMLCFGAITFGLTYESWINVTQAARESSRFGATYPMPTSVTVVPDSWLNDLGTAAAENAGIDLATTPASSYFICVGFVNSDASGTPPSKFKTWGSLSSTPASCTGSSLPDNRVEVKIQRKAKMDWIFGKVDAAVTGTNTSRYEPRLTP